MRRRGSPSTSRSAVAKTPRPPGTYPPEVRGRIREPPQLWGWNPVRGSSVPDESTHNDEPGIGTRRPDVDEANRDEGDPGASA